MAILRRALGVNLGVAWQLFFLIATKANCTLIGTGSNEALRLLESTSFKFYGEQDVSLDVTGSPVVELEWEGEEANALCSGYFDKKLIEKGYTDHVVVIHRSASNDKNPNSCESFVALYTKLSELKALAVVLVGTDRDIPGRQVFRHDWSWGLSTRYHQMPFLDVSNQNAFEIVEAIRAGFVVILESTPNAWLEIYETPLWIFLLRVLPASMSFITALAAFGHFIRHNDNRRISWVFSKMVNGDLTTSEVVLLVEIAAMVALSILFGCGMYLTGDAMPTIAHLFLGFNFWSFSS